MQCVSCQSTSQSVYSAEVNIHHPGREGLNKPTVWAFPLLFVCLDCGFTHFELSSLKRQQLKDVGLELAG